MRLDKPKFWDTDRWFIPILLFPFSLIILFLLFLKKKFTSSKKFNLNIICIGNIYVGGTGKTPTTIFLAKELTKSKKSPVILKKFYKNQIDEHGLIRNNFQNLILNKSRVEGVLEAEKKNHDIILMDDGFQDFRIKKDLNIICFNQNQLIGNGFTIPAGPLREPLSSLKRAQIILINGQKDIEFENKLLKINQDLEIFYSSYVPLNIDKFTNKNLIALAGIGNPTNFFNLLEKNNLIIKQKLTFPDHYEFSKSDIRKIINLSKEKNCQIIMTEKDYFKNNVPKDEIFQYLKVSLKVNNKEKLINSILKKI